MSVAIDTDDFSARMRAKAVRVEQRQLLVAKIGASAQAADLKKPANCNGFGRVRHFQRDQGPEWPQNPLPIDPAVRALELAPGDALQAQVFQNAACNWRCWYCFVPFPLLDGNEASGGWFRADELLDLYLAEPEATRPRMIDLTGGQPDLVPEWVPWTMEALRDRSLESKVFLWSDDNLSNDYFWRFLSEAQRELVSTFAGYSRVACFKGFDSESFAFNTEAAAALFDRQFDLFGRLLSTGMDLYGYVTFTTPNDEDPTDAMARFVDRLQELHENLPLRIVPLKVGVWGVVDKRLKSLPAQKADVCARATRNQQRAVDAWKRQLESRFPAQLRAASITDVSLRRR